MIGIIDSGVGGLSVYREIKKLLPTKKVLYLADQKNFPYGEKDKNVLLRIVRNNINKMLALGVKVVVLACNSATVSLINELRKEIVVPIIGIEPAIKVAAGKTQNNRIGLIATKMTVSRHENESLVKTDQEIIKIDCSELVNKIENDYSKITDDYLRRLILPLANSGVDSVVLGCTHYHFIKQRMENIFPEIHFYAPDKEVAARTQKVIEDQKIQIVDGGDIYLTSGEVDRFRKSIKMLLGKEETDVRKFKE